ncbi:Chromatin modification-related protein EAF1, partial [Candida tropicalis]
MAEAVEEYWAVGKKVCIKRKPIKYLDNEDTDMETGNEVNHDPLGAVSGTQEGNNIKQEEKTPCLENISEPEPRTIDTSILLAKSDDSRVDTSSTINITEHTNGSAKPEPPQERVFKSYITLDELKKIDQSIVKNLPVFSAFDNHTVQPKELPIASVSRLLYPQEGDEQWHKIVLRDRVDESSISYGPPEYQKGLFGTQSHRRFNPLKPPKPPLIKNIEYRSPTIWLPQDDKRLIHYVAEFCFNWDLISEHISSASSAVSLKKYESNIERRT